MAEYRIELVIDIDSDDVDVLRKVCEAARTDACESVNAIGKMLDVGVFLAESSFQSNAIERWVDRVRLVERRAKFAAEVFDGRHDAEIPGK